MNEDDWRLILETTAVGGTSDKLYPPLRGDAVAVFYDRAIARKVTALLNLARRLQLNRCEGATHAGTVS